MLHPQPLRITLIQAPLEWQSPCANRRHFAELMAPLAGQTDLILLPEMFATGFTMAPETHGEPADGETLAWMRAQSAQIGAMLCGSLAVKEGGNCFNRFYWVAPDGTQGAYDKRHLFRMGAEPEHYRPVPAGRSFTTVAGGFCRWSATTCAFRSGAAIATIMIWRSV